MHIDQSNFSKRFHAISGERESKPEQEQKKLQHNINSKLHLRENLMKRQEMGPVERHNENENISQERRGKKERKKTVNISLERL